MYQPIDVVAHKKQSPSACLTLTEGPRALAEAAAYGAAWSGLGMAPRGDGQPVMLLPGFLAGDASTIVCRRFLRRQGFHALPWRLGQNTGRAELQAQLAESFLQLTERYEQPISLVGHSLGGVFAREIARQHPQRVRSVVTLGSPFGVTDGGAVTSIVRVLFEQIAGGSVRDLRARLLTNDPSQPPGVPSSAVFSRGDGVVHWQQCLEQPSALTENIEVHGSHCGLIVNPAVLWAIADRLAQPQDGWQKFDPKSLTGRFIFPQRQAA